MAPAGVTFDDVVALASRFPGVEVGSSYGTPAVKVKGKLMVRLKEDGETIVLRTPFVVRDHLMHTQPAVFFITDHYKDYPSVLIRLSMVRRTQMTELLEAAWREFAPAKLVREFDAKPAVTAPHKQSKTNAARSRR